MDPSLQQCHLLSKSLNETVQEWWWATSEALESISTQLLTANYVIIDHFLTTKECNILYEEVQSAHKTGLLSTNGIIGGGRSGKDISFENPDIRGDILGYFDGTEDNWDQHILSRVLDKMVPILLSFVSLISF
jgi:hypothetical protein